MSETVVGIWSSLVRLAGSASGEDPMATVAPHTISSSFTQSLPPARPVQVATKREPASKGGRMQ